MPALSAASQNRRTAVGDRSVAVTCTDGLALRTGSSEEPQFGIFPSLLDRSARRAAQAHHRSNLASEPQPLCAALPNRSRCSDTRQRCLHEGYNSMFLVLQLRISSGRAAQETERKAPVVSPTKAPETWPMRKPLDRHSCQDILALCVCKVRWLWYFSNTLTKCKGHRAPYAANSMQVWGSLCGCRPCVCESSS